MKPFVLTLFLQVVLNTENFSGFKLRLYADNLFFFFLSTILWRLKALHLAVPVSSCAVQLICTGTQLAN